MRTILNGLGTLAALVIVGILLLIPHRLLEVFIDFDQINRLVEEEFEDRRRQFPAIDRMYRGEI